MKKILLLAALAHTVNAAYCAALGDTSQVPWEEAPQWQKDSAVLGVELHLENPNLGPQASHEAWLKVKAEEGWAYGETKDVEKKLHPCFVPFEQLSQAQQAKDFIFRAVVLAGAVLYDALGELPEPIVDTFTRSW